MAQSVGAPGLQSAEQGATSAGYGTLFHQFKEILDSAEAKVVGYDQLQASLENEKRSVEHLKQALAAQQHKLDSLHSQETLVARLTCQLADKTQALERLEAKCKQQTEQHDSAQTEAAATQQELRLKRKRVDELERDSSSKQQRVEQLEQELEEYRGLCSYVAAHTQRLQHQSALHSFKQQLAPHRAHPTPQSRQQNQVSDVQQDSLTAAAAADTGVSGQAISDRPAGAVAASPDNSVAEGVAGLLAMTSTADRPIMSQRDTGGQQSSEETQPPHWPSSSLMDKDVDSQDPKSEYVSKRASCVIIGRHPQAPREVRVACRQLIGNLVLAECCAQLKIRVASMSNKLLSPSEFEAAAGCSKGKNWKANIKVLGSNGRNQMLKVWLPGLMQLVGDHGRVAVEKDTDISELLDAETGLRISPDET